MAYQCECDICGNKFTHQSPHARRCSEECRKKFENRKTRLKQSRRDKRRTIERNALPQTCLTCGNDFIFEKQKKYCSLECRPSLKPQIVPGHLKVYRCPSCSVRMNRNRVCSMCKETTGILLTQTQIKFCLECNNDFLVIGTRKKFCSKECYIKFDKRSYPSGHRRRARKYGVEYDGSVNLNAALNRFGRICYLCDEFIMGGSSPTDPEQAVLEHIIPMAAGGTHTWDNVDVAHRRCNDIKARTSDLKLIKSQKALA